jgi:hypothetical protein
MSDFAHHLLRIYIHPQSHSFYMMFTVRSDPFEDPELADYDGFSSNALIAVIRSSRQD